MKQKEFNELLEQVEKLRDRMNLEIDKFKGLMSELREDE